MSKQYVIFNQKQLWFSSEVAFSRTVAPGTKSRAGASSNMTDFRFCEVQNRRRKCCRLVRKLMWSPKKKKVFTKILTVFPVEIRWSPKKGLHRNYITRGPLKSMGPGSLSPPAAPLGGPGPGHSKAIFVVVLSSCHLSTALIGGLPTSLVMLNVKRKSCDTNFIFFGVNQPGIEPKRFIV